MSTAELVSQHRMEAKSLARQAIAQVIDGEKQQVNIPLMPISNIGSVLVEFGFDEKPQLTGDDSCGTEVDFWYYWQHPHQGRYLVSGSLFHGDVTFGKVSEI